MSRRAAAFLLTIAPMISGMLGAQELRVRAAEAAVVVVVRDAGRASVQARYAFAGNPGAMSFEYLRRPCVEIGEVRIESDGGPVSYARVETDPWVRLHDTAAVDPARRSLGYTISYDVRLRGGEVSIPLPLPMATLIPQRRGAAVATLTAELPDGGRPTLPRMARTPDGLRWSARVAALPSALRVRLMNADDECRAAAESRGDSGRFRLIFWSFVATLALWVPLYLWWVSRQPEGK